MRTPPILLLALIALFGCPAEDPLDDDDGTESVELACHDNGKCESPYCDQILIPAGEFTMGTDHPPDPDVYWPAGDARPPHAVQLDAFCIDKYEVTIERYEACVDNGGCTPNGLEHEERAVETVVNHLPDQCWPNLENCYDHAVNAKNRWQAAAYCAHVGRRLCTEAEWERAANGPGPQKRLHPWGDEPFSPERVNVPSVGTGYVEPVHWFEDGQSVEGVFNLAGNVYEWVYDEYGLYEDRDDGTALVNPRNSPESASDDVIGRGSCFFTEPEHTVTDRSVFDMTFDWG
jgi:formylglycine-generating enzyme required for sulfatase activity